MSLYDDFDMKDRDQVPGWASGIKLFQSQMLLKKASLTQPKRESIRRANATIAPVIDLKRKDEINSSPISLGSPSIFQMPSNNIRDSKNNFETAVETSSNELDWNADEPEYSILFPCDYERVVRDLRDLRDREREREEEERKKRRDERIKQRERLENETKRRVGKHESPSDDEDNDSIERMSRAGGVAIAPPPMLQDASGIDLTPKPGSTPGVSVAAKIMAKYGFKEGQGLGKKEQGMAVALQVEKTSKRGGRIIHEKEFAPPPSTFEFSPANNSPMLYAPPPNLDEAKPDNSITEMMKTPSKVVLLKNMVGPGEVDGDLEPEVKDECNTKYGDVVKVVIHEIVTGNSEEAVRIFVEFKRIESAIKAVVDLNGRFFGGRQVKAGFYSTEMFASLKLLD